MKLLFIVLLPLMLSLTTCNIDGKRLRVEKLGKEIYSFALQGDYEAPLPKDLVFIGNNTFWKLLEINQLPDSVKIMVHERGFDDDRADYQIDFGTNIGLKVRYDSEIDKFHIVGYQGTITSINEDEGDKLFGLHQELSKAGKIAPAKGLKGMIIKESHRTDIFKKYNEKIFNRSGLFFDFQHDTLDRLCISRFQFETNEGIRPETGSKEEIINAYGEPIGTSDSIDFLNKRIKNVETLNYEGISFVLLKNDLMLIIIE